MRVILENWQQFLTEQNLSMKTKLLLGKLVNLKKFESVDDFLQRTKFYAAERGDFVGMVITIDGETAAYASFDVYDESEGCRPNPTQNMKTYEFKNVARGGGFTGYGLGKLIGFLAVCYINGKLDGTITSDRNTSDKASSQLIKNMSLIGAKKSDSFDYVGWLKTTIKRHLRRLRISINEAPKDKFRPREPELDPFGELPAVEASPEEFKQLVKDLYHHLEPMTPQESDDCQPSYNINYVQFVSQLGPQPEDVALMQKFLTMNSDQIQAFLDSDERVQGYTFTLPKAIINIGNEIIDAMDATAETDEEELKDLFASGGDLFNQVYAAEIDPYGRTIVDDS
jgi:hypothetical protein